MKVIPLVCSYCGQTFQAYAGRRTVVCTFCGRKCTHEDGRIRRCEFEDPPELPLVRKLILRSDVGDAIPVCVRLLSEDGYSPSGWLLKGFLQCCGRDAGREHLEPSIGIGKAFSSFRNAMVHLGSDYLFDDFIAFIGASLARRDLLGMDEARYIGGMMDRLAMDLDRSFGFDSRVIIWHLVCEGYFQCMEGRSFPGPVDDSCFREIVRDTVFFETDCERLIRGCRRMAILSERMGGKDRDLLNLIADVCEDKSSRLFPGDREKITSLWNSRDIELNLTDAWSDILKANGEELPDLFAPFVTRGPANIPLRDAVERYIVQFLHPYRLSI